MGLPDVNPAKKVGKYVKPKDWNKLISDPNTVCLCNTPPNPCRIEVLVICLADYRPSLHIREITNKALFQKLQSAPLSPANISTHWKKKERKKK